ncbi:DUF438 domain-containing protein [candidate division KSB1 bacterium]|nr:DUF438 domain-containing protein [candidate division KSB1 bacterium]
MSELINNDQKRKDLLKQLIQQLHDGMAPETVRKQLEDLLGKTPHEDVVAVEQKKRKSNDRRTRLSSGSFTPAELTAVLNTLPFDVTFVDKDDVVRYYSEGAECIFPRNRAVLGRKVQVCHPPKSVHIVQKILDDFRSGRESIASFWINMGGKFIHIEYFALRDEKGEYLGTLEVTQDLTQKRQLSGEQRLLSYAGGEKHE